MPPPRNKPMGIETRTMTNLVFIEKAHKNPQTKDQVHMVTQILNSLLGLVILPYGRHGYPYELCRDKKTLAKLYAQGWPKWEFSPYNTQETKTLGCLSRRLRNAAAHGRYTFDSDCLDPREVTITVKDKPPKGPINWCASIRADELHRFCRLLGKHMAKKHKGTVQV